jgi:eukaryotic-like serine/threonine-protein kinase
MSPLLGERKDRATYRILDKLSGGVGDDVFLAYHEIFHGTVVQKTVFMHGLEDALAANEPAFLNRLDHPRIVPVREAQWDPQQERAITFVMPHLAGGSVHEALVEGYRFSIRQSIVIAIDVLGALAYVHREFDALHRDTKPGNVLMDESRRHGYLTDFGSTATIDAQGTAAAVLGTNVYRPPEARPSGRVGVRADVYGIGLTLYEMLNGRLCWEELDLQVVEGRLRRGLRAVPDASLQFQPHIPDRLRRVVRKAIHRNHDERFESAEAFIVALRKVACIDWRRSDGENVEGTWYGTWPPQLREDRRVEYRVAARALTAGPNRGAVRVESDYRRPGTAQWRQAVADATITDGNAGALSEYFAQVEASAAHRAPAR